MVEKLTVLIPCKNESKNIRACIESVRELADEILIADCYSTDDTLNIVAKAGGCRVIQREFVNYADFKNWAIPNAKNPWVLIVDADERVPPELAAEIREALASIPNHIDAFFVPRLWHFMGHPVRFSGWQTDRLVRLIRRDRCRYRGCRVHEEIVYDKRRVRTLKNKLLHYSYCTYDDLFAKHVRYWKWAAEDLWEQGRRSSLWGFFVRPFFRFFHLYLIRLGFLDGLVGFQLCALLAFNSFIKQAWLWEMEHGIDVEPQAIHAAEPPTADRLAIFNEFSEKAA